MSRIRVPQTRKPQRARSSKTAKRGDGVADDPRTWLITALQSTMGNRAAGEVARRIARVQAQGPEPTASAPGSPISESTLGQTAITGSTQPRFSVQPEETKTGMRAKVAPTTEGTSTIDAKYTTEGVHPMEPSVDGTPRQLLVTPEVAELTKKGEQEHSDDFAWEHSLVFGEAARAVNVLSLKPAVEGPDIGAVHRAWRSALHDELSPKIRIEADASDPRKGGSVTGAWFAAKSKIHDASLERDRQQWHSMKIRKATVAEKDANPVPVGTVLVVTEAGGQIGKHPSEALMRAAFDALPDRA